MPLEPSCAHEGRFPRAIFLVLILVTLCLRVLGLMVRQEYRVPVQVGAEAGVIAQHIVDGLGFTSPYDPPGHPSPSTHLPPAYPYLLAGLMKLGLSSQQLYYDLIGINLVFAALLPAIVLAIGQTAGFPRPVSLLAALAMCLCPEAFRAPGLAWDEAIFVTLTALFAWWMIARLRDQALPGLGTSTWMGCASGVLALLNPAMVLALPFGWLAGLRTRGMAWRRVALHGVVFVVMTFVGSAPWHVRNWFLIQPPAYVFIRGPFWVATWTSMHPIDRIAQPDGSVKFVPLHPWNNLNPLEPWNGTDPMRRTENGVTRQLTEAEYFDWTKEKVVAAARENPMAMVRHVVDQFDAFWLGIAEAKRWYKNPWVFFVAQGVPALVGIVGLYLARKRIAAPVLALLCGWLLVFPVPYYIADAGARYRHPIDFVLLMGCAWVVWLVMGRRGDSY